jgi:hypothetical protein
MEAQEVDWDKDGVEPAYNWVIINWLLRRPLVW